MGEPTTTGSRGFMKDTATLALAMLGCATLLIVCAIWADGAMGKVPSYRVSTLVIGVTGLMLGLFRGRFSFQLISFVIIFFPAFSPFYAWDIEGIERFSIAARDLQADRQLIDLAVYVFACGAVAYGFGVVLGARNQARIGPTPAPVEVSTVTVVAIAALLLLSTLVIESGPSILTANYSEILEGRIERSTLIVLLAQLFGGFFALLFAFGRHKKVIFWLVVGFVMLWLLVHIRRAELFGVFLVLVMWWRYLIPKAWLTAIVLAVVLVLTFLGQMRHTSFSDHLSAGTLFEETRVQKLKADLPGGASNVFLSGLHLIKQRESAHIAAERQFTMGEWARAIVPNAVWTAFGFAPVESEHESIYGALGLVYVGGMPLIAAFFLNGGLGFVLIFGVFHGFVAQRVNEIYERDLKGNLAAGGTFPLFLSAVYLVYQFRYHWYNPQTLIRAMVYAACAYLVVRFAMRLRGDAGRLAADRA